MSISLCSIRVACDRVIHVSVSHIELDHLRNRGVAFGQSDIENSYRISVVTVVSALYFSGVEIGMVL